MKTQATARRRAFDGFKADAKPCPVCLPLAREELIQTRAVMPLPPFPARSNDNRSMCRDCQATELAIRLGAIPRFKEFGSARLCVANERCATLTLPFGMAEVMGMCLSNIVDPASIDDLETHLAWLERNGIEDSIQ